MTEPHLCRLAIVGSRTLAGNSQAEREILLALTRHGPAVVISGGAIGIDSMAEAAAKRLHFETSIFLPERKSWDGPGGYKERNARIANECEHLVCIFDPDSPTRGSGWTADLAEKLSKSVERIAVQAKERR